ncbi:MAG TPA: class I SAM-dependent rRNA methyltransferase [Fermentimonas sp.]|nr:class I SAM-dependent rRNA methyltransferase [Fermentimonas sp.]
MSSYKVIVLKPKKDDFIKRFHPWVFSGAIEIMPKDITEGEIVKVLSSKNEFLGVGHYQIGSIAVRILSFQNEDIDESFYEKRLTAAYNMRKSLKLISSVNDTYRLVHGEGDDLSGLIIDIYGKTAVIQSHTVGMHTDKSLIVNALKKVYNENPLENIYYKSEGTLPYKADLQFSDYYIYGGQNQDGEQNVVNTQNVALENGLKFRIDWLKGQKTGFFIDQRENRTLLEKYSEGRHVLNMFSYSGGFSVYALRGGAKEVVSVDSSSKALSIAEDNVLLNFQGENRHTVSSEDGFKYLSDIPQDKYDLIVLDPPAFAKHRGAINNALQGYKRLNHLALTKIAPGGILFTFSCSQAITKEQFRLTVFSAATLSGRKVQILHQLTQPADHPINIYHPEGEYLKGLVLYVE